MLSNSSQRQLRLEFLETRVNPTRLWFAANALPIPIGTATTTAITLQVPDALVVGDIDLWVNVTHECMDEISLRLRSPSGTIIQLATKQGGASKGYQNTIFDDQAANTLATFSESEGQRYQPEQSLGIFQQLSAQGEWQLLVDDANLQENVGSVNSFKLGFTTLPDDHGDSISTATPLVSTNVSTWSESGSIENTGDRDWFVWTAPANGSIQLSVNAANGSPIDTYLSLFDSQGVLIADDDDSGPGINSALFTSVKVGVDYKIEVIDCGISMGSYTLTLATIEDDHGSTPTTATPLTFNGSGTWSSAGNIQYSYDNDWFRWAAPADAIGIQVNMDAAGGVLLPYVSLLDSSGNSIFGTYAYSDSQGGSAEFTFSINPGAVYYISAQSTDSSLGSYTLTLATIEDDHVSAPATATSLTVSGSDTWSSAGSIQYSNDKDWFRWTAPADTAGIQVIMDAVGGVLAPSVTLLDSNGNSIFGAYGYSYSQGGSAEFTFSINSGAVYYIIAQSTDSSLGSYTITLITINDDHGSTLTTATPLTFNGSGTWSSTGNIQYSYDNDWFRWAAPADAIGIQVNMDAAGGGLLPYVSLLDSSGNSISGTYAYSDSQGGSAVFTVSIIPGAVYYIHAESYGSLGSYTVTLKTLGDDHGSTIATAIPLTLNNSSTWSSAGIIEYSDDKDWFRWTAPVDATVIQVTMDATGGFLQPNIEILDSEGNDIPYEWSYSPGGSAVSVVSINPDAVYYISAGSNRGSLGLYTVTLTTIDDDHGSTPATATPLTFSESDTWSSVGIIRYLDDDDWFRWTAPADATAIQVTMDAVGGVLRPNVELLDSGGNSIFGAYAYSNSQGGSAEFTVSINPGAVYYIRAQSNYDSLGSYTITLTTLEDDHGSTPATATSLALSGSGTWSSAGSIQYSNDKDWFRWTALADTAGIQVTMDAAGGVLRPNVELLDSGGNYISGAYRSSYSQGGSAEFTVSINPSAVYYIRAQSNYDSLGSYTITLTTLEDDHGSTPATATSLTVSGSGTWSSAGSIQYSNDNDWFRWTAPADAAGIQVTMDAAGGVLRPNVELLDSGGNYISGTYRSSYPQGGSAEFTVSINPGAVYYIRAQSNYDSLGSYTIKLTTLEDDHGSTPATATPLTLSGSGTWSSAGSIQYSNDKDWFCWTAPTDATAIQVTMDVAGGVLAPSVTLLDSNGNHISDVYNYTYTPGSFAVFTALVDPDAAYCISAQSADVSVGSYAIILRMLDDDHGSTPATATSLSVSGSGTWSSAGNIQYSNDKDWFQWKAPADASGIQVIMDAVGGVLAPSVTLLDSNGNDISDVYNYSYSPGSFAVFTALVDPDAVYYISAQSADDSLGSYAIILRMLDDDHGSTPATATSLTVSGSGTWSCAGSIQYSNDKDWFQWTAPTNCLLIQVTMSAAGGFLPPYVELRDSGGNVISGAHDFSESLGGSAVFTNSIIPGAVYYIVSSARASGSSALGSYTITLTNLVDDYGSSPIIAKLLPSLVQWSVTGEIDFSLDHDWFKWVVPLGLNRVRITMLNMGLPSQRMVLSIRNINQVELTGVSVLGGNRQAELLLDVIPGSIYYLDASSASSINSGIYQIFVYPIKIVESINLTSKIDSTDLNNGIAMAIISQPDAIVAVSSPSDGLATILLPAVGSAGGDVSNLAAIQVADEIIGGPDFVINFGGGVGFSLRDTIRNIKDAQEQLLIELRGFFAIIHTGALEMLLFDADGNTSRLPRQWKLAMAPWIDGVMMELHAVDRQASILFDLTSSGLKRVTAIVPPVWFDTVPAFTLEYANPDADESTSPWWASVVLMIGAKTWRIKKKSRLKV